MNYISKVKTGIFPTSNSIQEWKSSWFFIVIVKIELPKFETKTGKLISPILMWFEIYEVWNNLTWFFLASFPSSATLVFICSSSLFRRVTSPDSSSRTWKKQYNRLIVKQGNPRSFYTSCKMALSISVIITKTKTSTWNQKILRKFTNCWTLWALRFLRWLTKTKTWNQMSKTKS